MSESTSIQELNDLCMAIADDDATIKAEKQRLTDKQKELEKKKAKLLLILDENNMKTHKVGGFAFTSRDRFSVETPKGDDQLSFFNWCWEYKGPEFVRGSFKMNSMTLQGFFKAEMEQAAEEKNIDFKIPGIGEPKHVKTLSIRKG